MLTVFFPDAVPAAARRGWLLSFGLLISLEAFLFRRALPGAWLVLLILVAIGMVGVVIWRVVADRTSVIALRPALWVDQLFFLFLGLSSVMYAYSYRLSAATIQAPAGRFLTALSVPQEFLTVLLLGTFAATAGPSRSDLALVRHFRDLDYYPILPFSGRRTTSALAVILVFWSTGILVLGLLSWPLASVVFLFAWILWTIIYWERLYGYQSRIVYVYTAAGMALGSVGLLLSTSREWVRFVFDLKLFLPVLGAPVGVLGYGTYYALNRVWTVRDKKFLVAGQRTSHTLMTLLMLAVCAVIYVLYLVLPMYDYWSDASL